MAAGSLSLALSQQVDVNGKPLAGALLYTFVVGTVAQPQTTYQDTALTIANPWPLTADQNGRLPMFYLADGSTHARLTDSTGNVQYDSPSILVIGPSGGGGGGSAVDPTTVISTGDLKVKYGTGPLSGFVRANGLTIGNSTSGAAERANADTQSLFVYLYNADANLVVSGGRTGNALNDYNSSKTITLPDWRGRTIAALDDMGNTAAGRLTSTYFGASATVLGASGGSQNHTQTVAELAPHFHSAGISDPGHTHTYTAPGGVAFAAQCSSCGNVPSGVTSTSGTATTGVRVNSPNGLDTTYSTGGGTPFAVVQPTMLATVYLKL